MTLRIYRGKTCIAHEMGEGHPESPDRLYAIDDQLLASGLEMICEHADATPVSQETLKLAHDPYYVQSIFQRAPEHGLVWLDNDTAMSPHTLNAALEAAGAACDAVDYVLAGDTRQAFCLVRPPGHHAEYACAMGFCIFNNVAVAARYALSKPGIERVAIVDFDVHHGNGTEDIVKGDNRILFCSSFQHPFYPHSGSPAAAENVHVAPLNAGTTGAQFRQAISGWFPVTRDFAPQLIIVSAGFDGHAEDHMAHWQLRENDYLWVSACLREIADECCKGRIVSSLEGGYNLSALGRSVVAHLRGIAQVPL